MKITYIVVVALVTSFSSIVGVGARRSGVNARELSDRNLYDRTSHLRARDGGGYYGTSNRLQRRWDSPSSTRRKSKSSDAHETGKDSTSEDERYTGSKPLKVGGKEVFDGFTGLPVYQHYGSLYISKKMTKEDEHKLQSEEYNPEGTIDPMDYALNRKKKGSKHQ
ncbi:hypothetical protein AMATHDRAFT_70225 [Amanita thiersii Skay4041]|uniref:Uncharacterized protein n=1 Tax=Amanita thiersii Skay4041 TaxID=703135 RepID=A0A2A9NAC6_9AGAR|nr:hypothetical protein AMATHDRAFT_70225 [Amanita thiersii Skay4041]